MTAPTRPVLRYHGGKWRMAPWILSHFPAHRVYLEPFGGAASVLMRKSRSYAEIYNDLDSEVVNVFEVMRCPALAGRLLELLRLTPFARDEFEAAYHVQDEADPVERARLTLVKSFMGFGSAAIHDHRPRGMRTRAAQWRAPTGFRGTSKRSGTTPAHDWSHYPMQLVHFCERLQGVVIENRPALELIDQHAGPDALIYVDPPYVHDSRSGLRWPSDRQYTHEMDDDQHRELAEVLRASDSMVVISGYASPLYDYELYPDWRRLERVTTSEKSKKRTEVLWINQSADQLRFL